MNRPQPLGRDGWEYTDRLFEDQEGKPVHASTASYSDVTGVILGAFQHR